MAGAAELCAVAGAADADDAVVAFDAAAGLLLLEQADSIIGETITMAAAPTVKYLRIAMLLSFWNNRISRGSVA